MALVASKATKKFGYRMGRKQRRVVGPALHYGFGAMIGAAYAVAAENRDFLRKGYGAGFGSAVFAVGDALSPREFMPAVPPFDREIVSGVYEWLSHVVYGVTLETTRRGATRWLGDRAA